MKLPIDVAGLKIHPVTKTEFLSDVILKLEQKQQQFVLTAYSEFLYHALRSEKIRSLLNSFDYRVADGVGIQWAQVFLTMPIVRIPILRSVQAFGQVIWTLFLALFRPGSLSRVIPERIVGSQLFRDLAELAECHDFSLYLLGGYGDTPSKAAKLLRVKHPRLRIVGARNWSPGQEDLIVPDLIQARPDILMVAFGPLRQEQWIMDNVRSLPVGLAIGLGGAFDYAAGRYSNPYPIIRFMGLEWLFRLVTQPRRFKRIMQATFGLTYEVRKFKLLNKG